MECDMAVAAELLAPPLAVSPLPVDLRLGGDVLSSSPTAMPPPADLDETELGVLLGVPLPPLTLGVPLAVVLGDGEARRRESSRRAMVFLRFFLSDFLTDLALRLDDDASYSSSSSSSSSSYTILVILGVDEAVEVAVPAAAEAAPPLASMESSLP